jgi:hypothetical protein
MLHWLQAVVGWMFSGRSSFVQLSIQAPNTVGASRNRGRGPDPPKSPSDPDSWVRTPKGRAPTGRSSSVAVAEPVDDERVVAVGAAGTATERPFIDQATTG